MITQSDPSETKVIRIAKSEIRISFTVNLCDLVLEHNFDGKY